MNTIVKPGVYFGVPAADYHADPTPEPSLSTSIAKILLNECPYLAWREHPRLNPSFVATRSEKFDLGSAAHALTLNDERAFEIIDADSYRSNDAKRQRQQAWDAGKIPLLTEQYERTLTMVRAGKPQFEKLQGGDPFGSPGNSEVTLVWREGDVWCRARLDRLRDDRAFFPDFKWTETSVAPDDLPRHIYNMGYDVQEAFYRRGIIACGLHDRPEFRFYFQSEDDHHLVSPPMAPTPRAMDLADRKVERALAIWRECRKTNLWPEYPKHVCHYDPPGWHEAQFEERALRDADIDARRPSAAAVRRATDFHRPLEGFGA